MTGPESVRRWSVIALLLMACGGSAPHVNRVEAAPSRDPLNSAVVRVERALSGSGLTRAADLSEGMLAEGQGVTLSFEVPAATCAVLTAVGTRGVADLDATIYSGDGQLLVRDQEPDARPTVALCADREPLHLYYRVDAYRGVGRYAVLRFDGAAAALGDLRARLGGTPGVVQTVGEPTELMGWIAGAQRRGFSPRGAHRMVRLLGGTPVRLPLPMRSGRCVAVIAVPHAPLVGVELVVRDASGAIRSEDRAETPSARTQACARVDGDWTVELVPSGGEGEAELVVLDATQAELGTESALFWGVRPQTVAIEGDGQELGAGALSPGQVARVTIPLATGACVDVWAEADAALGRVSIRQIAPLAGSPSERVQICRPPGSSAPELALSARGAGRYRLLRSSAEAR